MEEKNYFQPETNERERRTSVSCNRLCKVLETPLYQIQSLNEQLTTENKEMGTRLKGELNLEIKFVLFERTLKIIKE